MKGVTMWKIMVLVVGIILAGFGSRMGRPPATAPATQPSKLATERAEALKENLKNFTLRLSYYGEENKPYYRLLLSVPPLPLGRKRIPSELENQITADQAKKIIDYLATEGFLERAVPATDERVLPRGPGYLMSLSDGLWESLGWGLPMLQRLDGLRTVLDGDAAKQMDLLLGRLAGEREEWKKAAATQPASSKPATKDGLQVTVTLLKTTFAATNH